MKKINFAAHCAFNLILALSATLLPLKPTNVFAEDSTLSGSSAAPPGSSSSDPAALLDSVSEAELKTTSSDPAPTCKEGYEYVESAGKCYKKCQDGWARNSETNRCRKIVIEAESEYEPYKSSGSSSVNGSGASSSSSSNSSSVSSLDVQSSSPSSSEAAPTCKDGYEYVESAGKCYKACSEGQIRNSETNRCKKASSESNDSSENSSTENTTCKDGYEYVESAGKCYKKCADGQIRNPETNRCKKAESDETTLKECQEGYERNPETNRCRKIKANDGADYGIDVPKTGGSASFVAGGIIIALIAAGGLFIAFQYRQELKDFLKKRFKKSKKSS